MPWMICADASMNTKTQFINANNFNRLITYMESKYPEFSLDVSRADLEEQIFFEYGGTGALVGAQPKMNFLLPTSTLRLDCLDVPKWIKELKQSVRREFHDGTPYYKVYSRFACLILTPAERESLLFQLARQEDKANRESKEFFEDLHKSYEKMEYNYNFPFPVIDLDQLKPPDDDPEPAS